jgi:quinoprotein glucose dehydrogenase
VPQSDVEGERTWPTQPFPALLPQLGLHHVSPDDAWGLTPEDRELARKRIAALRYEGIFTPPSLKGSIIAPSNVGGINWGGLSIDPRRGLLVTNVNRLAAVITLVPRKDVAGAERASRELPFAEVSPQKGTPYALKREYLIKADERGMQMQTPPPWGTLAAVNINTGELEWEVPLGFMLDLTAAPEAENWGSLSLGGPLTTAGGLVFVAATIDGHFRAFDIETGELLWKVLLPAGGQATPMSYQVEEAGKQYVVICAGGHGKMKTKLGDYVVAYALP